MRQSVHHVRVIRRVGPRRTQEARKRRQEQEAGLVGDPAQLRTAVEARLFILSLAQVSLEPGGYAPQREPRSVQ